MIKIVHTLKQYAMLDIYLKNDPFFRARVKLTVYYVLFVTGILAIFSFGLHMLFVEDVIDNIVGYDSFVEIEELGDTKKDINDKAARLYFFNQMNDRLTIVIILLDGIILIMSILISYYFAGKTLIPIKEVYDMQKKFIADAAHEFRTPLTVLKTGAESALTTNTDLVQYQKLAHDFIEEVDYLTNLVNDLLFLAKWNKRTKDSFEIFDFSALLLKRINMLLPYAIKQNVHFKKIDIENKILLKGNSTNIMRLLLNVIKNAIDYNKINGEILISLSKKESKIILMVTDTGIGLSKKDKEYIFDRFYKADNARTGGVGLGMSIVKEIVEQHDAEIFVESKILQGTTVKIIFPIKK